MVARNDWFQDLLKVLDRPAIPAPKNYGMMIRMGLLPSMIAINSLSKPKQ
jgi:hypothetical protein